MGSSFFCDVTQRRLIFIDISGQTIVPSSRAKQSKKIVVRI
jgi:hypothetical protein